MTSGRIVHGATLTAVFLFTTACATADPFGRHARTADLKAAAADPTRLCDVEVLNATDQMLNAALVEDGGADRDLGLITSGQSVRLPVECRVGRVTATAVSQDWGDSGGQHFRAAARLDLLRPTVLRFTQTERVVAN